MKLIVRDRSTETKGKFILLHFLYATLLAPTLYLILPVLLPLAKHEQSVKKLVACMFIVPLFGIVTSYAKRRTKAAPLFNSIAGLGAYVFITLGKYTVSTIKFLFWFIFCITLLSVFVITFRKIKNKNRVKTVIIRRLYNSGIVLKNNLILTFSLILVLTPTSIKLMDQEKLFTIYTETNTSSETIYENRVYGDEYRLYNNLDTISLIADEKVWAEASYEKRIQVYEAVALCEARHVGIPFQIQIVFTKDLPNNIRGCYSHQTKTVSFNANLVMELSAEETLNVILHELRHVYQRSMTDLYYKLTPQERALTYFEEVRTWAENYETYISGRSEDAYLGYLSQPVERDSRNYASQKSVLYLKEIEALLSTNN